MLKLVLFALWSMFVSFVSFITGGFMVLLIIDAARPNRRPYQGYGYKRRNTEDSSERV